MLPTLYDGDLTLRPRLPRDVEALVEACQDPEIPRWTRVPSPYTRAHALEFIALTRREAESGEAIGLFAVDAEDRLLGSFSLMDLKAEPGYGELGYWVAAPARGRGVATRASRLLTGWGHADLGLERIEIVVHRDNAASHRVPERLGYERLPGLHPLERAGVTDPVFVRYLSRAARS